MRRNPRTIVLSTLAAISVAASGLFGAGAANAAAPLPASIVALGDSLSVSLNSCGYRACAQDSWSTGSTAAVNSHASRLRAAGATTLGVTTLAVSGKKSADLPAQAQAAVAANAGYVTLQIGANDACTPTVAAMTTVAAYEASIAQSLATLRAGLPTAPIFVASIPNLKQVWALSKDKIGARLIWGAAKVCPSMLANPTSTRTADVQRRDAVQLRVTEYNAALQRQCAAVVGCWYDGGAVANFVLTSSDITTRDYFHPTVSGQAKLAAVTWPLSPFGS